MWRLFRINFLPQLPQGLLQRLILLLKGATAVELISDPLELRLEHFDSVLQVFILGGQLLL